jgi:hypothetical protein
MLSFLTKRRAQVKSGTTPPANRSRALSRQDRETYHRLLSIGPRPLFLPDTRLMVIFSPKSACTNVVIWTLAHLGLIDEARAYNEWPHRYRKMVYYNSPLYRAAIERDPSEFKVLRVVRDPFDRAVSGFKHALRARATHPAIAGLIGYDEIESKGLSFEQFLDFLERSDLMTCNGHFRVQRHPVEDLVPTDYLINISKDDLFKRLGEIEQELGLAQPAPQMSDWLHRLRKHRRPDAVFDNVPNLTSLLFTAEQARKGPWPRSQDLLTPSARERLAKLYAADIRSYL